VKDLYALDPAPSKVRRPGGGRPPLTQTDPTLLDCTPSGFASCDGVI
jgi:hypothetical protein